MRAGDHVVLIQVPAVGSRGHVEALVAQVDSLLSGDCDPDTNRVATSLEDSVYSLTLLDGQVTRDAVLTFAVHAPSDRIRATRGGSASVAIDGIRWHGVLPFGPARATRAFT